MYIVRLSSGLGNQLFMYAFYLHLKRKSYENIYFDDKYFKHDSFGRKPELSIIFPNYPVFNFKFNPAGERGLKRRCYQFVQKKFPRFHYVDETDYDDKIIYKDNTYFSGYWQKDDFICNNDLSHFVPKEEIPTILKPYLELINNTLNAVSIHFRRKDFFSPENIHRFGVCKEDYYQKAMNKLESELTELTYFVFSDDIDWVKENIYFSHQYVIIPNFSINSFWYIYLQSLCKHNIISNSTFSWWGARLNTNKNKIVIAPSKWMLDTENSIVLEDWQKIKI